MELRSFHEAFVKMTLELGGTFYLPYRHHYSHEEMEKAYGKETLLAFFREKERYDPGCTFSSMWFRAYAPKYLSDSYREKLVRVGKSEAQSLNLDITPFNFGGVKADYKLPIVSERRSNSYRRLFANPQLRREFLEGFLVNVFNIEDPSLLFRIVSRAVWDPNHKDDLDVYASLQDALTQYLGLSLDLDHGVLCLSLLW